MSLITVDNISVVFQQRAQHGLLKDHIREKISSRPKEKFYALQHVSLKIGAGEGVAIIGQNGAGKSTLLSAIGGLLPPDEGRVTVADSVILLMELGSGFHPDLTGQENVWLNAALLGLSQKQTEDAIGPIVEFSEIGEFIDQPLRTYSSGMVLRLAFAVAVHAKGGILVIDEVLAVGDSAFQAKCRTKILEMREQGRTLVCVSHQGQGLAGLCDRAIWLHRGEVVRDGDLATVMSEYTTFMMDPDRHFGDSLGNKHAMAQRQTETDARKAGGRRKR
jgi:ABC-type polysaccharide/polyol phosphate transport system ATPase subunit